MYPSFISPEAETEWNAKAVESLIKKLKRDNNYNYEELIKTLNFPEQPSKCITVPRTLDGRLQICGLKALPHLIFCRIWRWPDIRHRWELESERDCNCEYPFSGRKELVCINPSHYRRVETPPSDKYQCS